MPVLAKSCRQLDGLVVKGLGFEVRCLVAHFQGLCCLIRFFLRSEFSVAEERNDQGPQDEDF